MNIVQIFQPPRCFVCFNETNEMKGPNKKTFLFKKYRPMKCRLKVTSFQIGHDINCAGSCAKIINITDRMIQKIMLGHLKNGHSEMQKRIVYLPIVFWCFFYPNIYIAGGSGIPMQDDREPTHLNISNLNCLYASKNSLKS